MPTPEGTCIVFGDFLTALDVPMKIDLEAKSASGWAFKEDAQDRDRPRAPGQVRYGAQAEALASGAMRDVPEGWCVDIGGARPLVRDQGPAQDQRIGAGA